METERITVDRAEAEQLWRKYQEHMHWSEPVDREIAHIYEGLAKGKTYVQAIASIAKAGLNDQGLPKLALVQADKEWCRVHMDENGGARFYWSERWPSEAHWRTYIDVPAKSFPPPPSGFRRWHHEALVPLVPIHIRPRRALAAYAILFEAEWTRIVPKDPMLLRRVGRSDLWLLCGAWDLTEVERAVLASRLRS